MFCETLTMNACTCGAHACEDCLRGPCPVCVLLMVRYSLLFLPIYEHSRPTTVHLAVESPYKTEQMETSQPTTVG